MILRSPYPDGGAFSPSDLSGLVAWYKADALALSNGAAVATWADSSGSGNTATQGTAGLQPTYQTAVQNGLPVVRFADNGRQMTIPTLTLSAYTIVGAYQSALTAAALQYLVGGNSQGMAVGGTFTYHIVATDGSLIRDSTTSYTTWGHTTWQAAHLYHGSSELAYNQTDTPTAVTLTRLGGRSDAANLGVTGDVGEVTVYNRVLSGGELTSLWAYFARWN